MLELEQYDTVTVAVYTSQHKITGNIHLSRVSKPERRLTDLLNSNLQFLVLTDAQILDRKTGEIDPTVYPLIHVGINTIELIQSKHM